MTHPTAFLLEAAPGRVRLLLLGAGLFVLGACSPAPPAEAEDTASVAAGSRPAPASPDTTAEGLTDSPAGEPSKGVQAGAPGDLDGAGPDDDVADASGTDDPDADGPVRPAMDMDASGPMIHPRRTERADFADARFARPEHIRGLYLNAWASGSSRRLEELITVARETEINAFVIDIKDATGYVSHSTSVPMAHEVGATGERRIRDLGALLDRLEAEGIYPIARIVVVKDPLVSAARPELAVQDTAGGVWIDSKEIVWLNLYSRDVWDYHVQIAREVAEMGFPEIQWDYIRFPDAPESDMARAVFPGSEGLQRVDAVRGFLAYARDELSDLPVRSTADVFGVTTTFRRDVGIGQLWESFIDVVDAALPMVYPSHYWEGSFGYSEPNAYPYEVVRAALRDAIRRSELVDGAGLTRPWLQDFSLGKPAYGEAEVRAQIQATYDAGIQEWVLWNPSSRYTISAIEPVDGFEREPLMRVAGTLAPVSRRQIVMDSVAAVRSALVGPRDTLSVSDVSADTVVPAAIVDSAAAPGAVVDSVGAERPDTLRLPSGVAPEPPVAPATDPPPLSRPR